MESTQRWTVIVTCVFLGLSSPCSGANSYVWSNSNTRTPTSGKELLFTCLCGHCASFGWGGGALFLHQEQD